jgi:uncharacterized protein (TIGR03437 family)
MRRLPAMVLCAAGCFTSSVPSAQVASSPVVLVLDIENLVEYQNDVADPAKFATNEGVTPAATPSNFLQAVVIGDIVAVNGEPAKGTFVGRPAGIRLSPEARRGLAVADTTRISIGLRTFEILKVDGTPIGTIVAEGLNGGTTPPGPDVGGQNFAIVGGTGAFLGARGQQGGRQFSQRIAPRGASVTEDPANRRRNGGGKVRWVLAVFPMTRPEVVVTASGPSIAHLSDHTLVTSSNPARPGEMLSLVATGLGPTVPPVDFGQPFPSSPPAAVNSPLQISVNGKRSQVRRALGVPRTVDAYDVEFQVPPEIAAGQAPVQLTAAWISGPTVEMPIR